MKKLILLPVILFTLTGCWEIGTGNKVGVITKLNKQGMFCKTWQGQIIRGGMNNGSGSFGSVFTFNIDSDELAAMVQQALDEQKEVKIHYHREFATFCRNEVGMEDDGYNNFLDKIEVLNSKVVN